MAVSSQRPHAGSRRRMHAGFSMLEMLLALAILGGALAVLSRIGSDGTNIAIEARELASCRIIAQRKMAEMLLETTVSPISQPAAPIESFDSLSSTAYEAAVEVRPAQFDGILVIRVRVTATNPDSSLPYAEYVLDRWMLDPALGLAELEAAEAEMIQQLQASNSSGSAGGL